MSYSHGVLIGNRNEDAFGKDIFEGNTVSSSHPKVSIQQGSYRWPDELASRDYVESKMHSVETPSLEKDLLFAHRGDQPKDARYETTTHLAQTLGREGFQSKPLTKLEKKKLQWAKEKEENSRHRTYTTTNGSSWHS